MLIIDDIAPALALLPQSLRTAMAPMVQRMRARVRAYAHDRSYKLIRHDEFTDWFLAAIAPGAVILSLDPLVDCHRDPRIHRVSAHRFWSDDQLVIRTRIEGLPGSANGAVMLVDDAAYTGSTLNRVLEALAHAGFTVSRTYVGAAKPAAVRNCSLTRIVPFAHLEKGDILHLRDYCPLLPFSGRSLLERGEKYRVAALLERNGAAQHLHNEPVLRQHLLEDCGAILRRIDEWSGELVTPARLRQICPAISIPLPDRSAEADPQKVFDLMRERGRGAKLA